MLLDTILANLIEVWHSEDYTQGYVKHSNGLLEQWGARVPLSDNYPTRINLFKSFLNISYSIIGTWCNDKEASTLQLSSDYKDSFTVYTQKKQTEPRFNWYAVGFWK